MLIDDFLRMLLGCACTRAKGLRLLAKRVDEENERKELEFSCFRGPEPFSRRRIPLKVSRKHGGCASGKPSYKPPKPHRGESFSNDFRAKQARRRAA